jgi:hypothetical protein
MTCGSRKVRGIAEHVDYERWKQRERALENQEQLRRDDPVQTKKG